MNTSHIRQFIEPEGVESKAYLDFLSVLDSKDRDMYLEYLGTKVGSAYRLAKKYGYPSHKALLDRCRDLRAKMIKASAKYRVELPKRTQFIPAERVPFSMMAEIEVTLDTDKERLFLVMHEDVLTWVDVEGKTFHKDVLAVLDNLYENSPNFIDLEVEVVK